ncbi:MAG TPA: hypothetical protein VMV92_21010, partial [Streptosporangiaceae bacterium]|nr:hypothetical protein [Streptosporangiaceae bacterium]
AGVVGLVEESAVVDPGGGGSAWLPEGRELPPGWCLRGVVEHEERRAVSYAAANTGENLAGLISQAGTDSVACGGFAEGSPASQPSGLNALTAPGSVSRPAEVVSDTRTFYDDPAFSATFPQANAPAKGDVTMTGFPPRIVETSPIRRNGDGVTQEVR